jgi:copper(I)-binding protein
MAKVVVTGAHINTPVVSDMTGAFATVTNNSSGPVRLISVSVPSAAAQSASLHTMAMVDGKMAMTPVKGGIVIPARSTLQLKSGGFHMMLMMPMLKSGEVVPITFAFSNGLKVTAAATVAKPVSSPTPSMSSSM